MARGRRCPFQGRLRQGRLRRLLGSWVLPSCPADQVWVVARAEAGDSAETPLRFTYQPNAGIAPNSSPLARAQCRHRLWRFLASLIWGSPWWYRAGLGRPRGAFWENRPDLRRGAGGRPGWRPAPGARARNLFAFASPAILGFLYPIERAFLSEAFDYERSLYSLYDGWKITAPGKARSKGRTRLSRNTLTWAAGSQGGLRLAPT